MVSDLGEPCRTRADRSGESGDKSGIHVSTWIAPTISKLLDEYLDHDWREHGDEPSLWNGIFSIPDEELWAARQALKGYLIAFVRERARARWVEQSVSPAQVVAAGTLLDPAALTIGFARRFTGYKRPELIFTDAERLAEILNSSRYPVQIIFAGKAHPEDDIGKHHLQHVYKRAMDPALADALPLWTTTTFTWRTSLSKGATSG